MKYLLAFLFFLFPISVHASDYYAQTRLNTLYDQTGESISTLKIILRNQTTQNYPVSLKVNIHGDRVDIIKAADDYGDLNYIYTYKPSGINTLEIKFNRRMVGKDVLTHLNLTYKNPKAERTENTWVVFFPKISLDLPGDYVYQVEIPKSFGHLIAAETLPEIKLKSDDADLYILKGTNLPTSNRLIFGDTYPFAFTLIFNNTQQIVLPKDTNSQKIYITKITPQPDSVVLENNDWVAKYHTSQEKIVVNGNVVLFNQNSNLEAQNITEITPHPYQYLPAKSVNISLTSPKYLWPFINNKIFLHLKNPNFQALYNINLNIDSKNSIISTIPPSGSVDFPVSMYLSPLTVFTPKSLELSSGDLNFSYNPNKGSLIFYYLVSCALISLIFILTVYFTHLSWRLFLQRRGKTHHLRR